MSESWVATDELLAAARAGDANAWGQLLQHYRPYLILLAEIQLHHLVKVKADPNDVVQDTFLQAHQDRSQFHGQSVQELLSWLREILASQLSSLNRRYLDAQNRDVRRERELVRSLTDSSRQLDELQTASSSSPSRKAARNESAARVAAVLEQLTPDHRTAIILRHIEGLSFAEMGTRMDRKEDAARKLWARAIQSFRDQFDGGTDGSATGS